MNTNIRYFFPDGLFVLNKEGEISLIFLESGYMPLFPRISDNGVSLFRPIAQGDRK